MSVKLAPEPKMADPSAADNKVFMITAIVGVFSIAPSLTLLPSPSNFVVAGAFLLVSAMLCFFSRGYFLLKAQAQLNDENEGRRSHIFQIEKAYGVKFLPQPGFSKMKKLPAIQDVVVVFNGNREPMNGILSVVDGHANLNIKMSRDLVPAYQISAEN